MDVSLLQGANAKVAGWGQGLFGTAGSVILNLSSRAFQLNPLIAISASSFIWGYDDGLFTLSKLDPTNKVPMDQVGLMTSVSLRARPPASASKRRAMSKRPARHTLRLRRKRTRTTWRS